jgi:hypothetical protein
MQEEVEVGHSKIHQALLVVRVVAVTVQEIAPLEPPVQQTVAVAVEAQDTSLLVMLV